jgi:outer membrane protein OmpA-like peptidoglycan-associated protein
MKLKTSGKITILVVVVGLIFGGYRLMSAQNGGGGGMLGGLIPKGPERGSKEVKRVDLPPDPGQPGYMAPASLTLPSTTPANLSSPEIRFLHWAWNSQMGMMLANGGKEPMQGSLMAKKNINLHLVRQDDAVKMQEELVAFAQALKNGQKQPDVGANFVAIMGDGSAAFLAGVNETLKRLGPEYKAKVVGSCGYSRGEDKFMGPQSWKDNPASSKGGVTSGYLRDGDWNITLKWLGDNGLRNNPDETTYDPDAMNWVSANDYLDACEKYITGYTETRPVVRNGKRTGETKTIHVDGVVTWTPGDVNIARQKGGIVSIVSTREYSTQMPNTIIGIDKWMKENRSTVEGMLSAIFEGGAMVRSNQQALSQAAAISSTVYGEQDAGADYWEKYYKGVIEKDKQGLEVELGGSSVNTLADNMVLFGLQPGSSNLFAATYTVFGNVVREQYPDILPSFDPVDQILDTSYVSNIAARSGPTKGDLKNANPTFDPNTKPTRVISKRSWQIQFNTGNANFTQHTQATLQTMLQDLLIAGSAIIEIRGHTDNVGDADANMALSESRAFAVKKWLEAKAPGNFPKGRIRVRAYGETSPLVPNSSPANQAINRRVEIVLGVAE